MGWLFLDETINSTDMIDTKTTCRALGFLIWFHQFYREGVTCDTYEQIASNYGQCNYGTVRAYLLELEVNGYVQIENRAKRTQRFIINEEKYKNAVL